MTHKRISVAGADEPTGWWFKPARYIVTWIFFLWSVLITNITQRTVVRGRRNTKLKPRRIYAVTHRTLWDSFWIGGIIGSHNLGAVCFRQNLLPANMPDGLNFMDTPTMWLIMRMLRCWPVHRKRTIERLADTTLNKDDVTTDKLDTNARTWQGIKDNLKQGGTLLWFMTSGRDVIRDEHDVVIDGTPVSRPILTLGQLLLELEAEGCSVDVVPVYTVNDNQTYRKTRDDVPGPWHLVPEWKAIRKTVKMVAWIFAQRPFRYRNSECLVAHFGDPIPSAELVAQAGNGNRGRRHQSVANAVADAIRTLKPATLKFRQQPDLLSKILPGRKTEAA